MQLGADLAGSAFSAQSRELRRTAGSITSETQAGFLLLIVMGFLCFLFEYYSEGDFKIVLSQRHVSMNHPLHPGI